jgi:hypothetical protein
MLSRPTSDCTGYYLTPATTFLFRVVERCLDPRTDSPPSDFFGPLETQRGMVDAVDLTLMDPLRRRFIVSVPGDHQILTVGLDDQTDVRVIAGCGAGERRGERAAGRCAMAGCDYAGDGGPAKHAQLCGPSGIAVDEFGRVFIADTLNHRIRMIENDNITTVFGSGRPTNSRNPEDALLAPLSHPKAVRIHGPTTIAVIDFYGRAGVVDWKEGVVETFVFSPTTFHR